MTAVVAGIFTSPTAGKPMISIAEATLEPGHGLVGDRYYAGAGTFSRKLKGRPDAELTLIESEEIERFNAMESLSVTPGELRRNIVTRGIRLNDLVGRTFAVGASVLEGIRLCEPCAHLAELVSPKVLPAMTHRAGLRARIVVGAVIRPGDHIALLQPG